MMIEETGPRIKYDLTRLGSKDLTLSEWGPLAYALSEMESFGCFPVTSEGLVCGNIAAVRGSNLIVSRSGRTAGPLTSSDFATVVHFERRLWKAYYLSAEVVAEPTSDTPLYWTALMEMPHLHQWEKRPMVAMHGHSLSDERAASLLGVPISRTQTEFSTPEDRDALAELFKAFPYPRNRIYIRRDHGFFILGETVRDLMGTAKDMMNRWHALGGERCGDSV